MRHTVVLIRHAESEMNVRRPSVIGGRSRWCELTKNGVKQAKALGQALKTKAWACERVVSSTAVRAQQTARYCLEEVGYPLPRLETYIELEEMDQGDWENQPRNVIYTPQMQTRINEERWTFSPPGGESWAQVWSRAHTWIEREILNQPPQPTWVVSHGGVIQALLTGYLHLPKNEVHHIPIGNASVTVLEHENGRWVEQMRAQRIF